MKLYNLKEYTVAHPHGIYEDIIATSTNKKMIFDKAAKLSKQQVKNRSSWKDITYWVEIFDSNTGRKLDELEFDSNGRQEGTFGKIVRNRGSRDEKVVGSWL